MERISKLVADGARLEDCIVIEIFARSGRVTACMKQLGALSAFGVDHVRSKQCMSQFVIADLCTPEGVSLLWQWLAQENVVAIFLAPPCGSASRARQIPLKRAMGKNSHGPLPLRDDLNPNGKPGLSFRDRQRISLANKLYHLTSQLVERANTIGCIVCVENPVYPVLGDYVLVVSCKTNAIRSVSFVSIWEHKKEENYAGFQL